MRVTGIEGQSVCHRRFFPINWALLKFHSHVFGILLCNRSDQKQQGAHAMQLVLRAQTICGMFEKVEVVKRGPAIESIQTELSLPRSPGIGVINRKM